VPAPQFDRIQKKCVRSVAETEKVLNEAAPPS